MIEERGAAAENVSYIREKGMKESGKDVERDGEKRERLCWRV